MSTKKILRPPKPLIVLGIISITFSSCMIFKSYAPEGSYKDNNREIILKSDSTIIIGNKAAEIKAVQNELKN